MQENVSNCHKVKDLLDSSSDDELNFSTNFIKQKKNGEIRKDHSGASSHKSCAGRSVQKKRKNEGGSEMDSKYLKMMVKMGYQEGKGLGKEQQGIVEPVKASKQIAKRGLGFSIPELDDDNSMEWIEEECSVQEEITWLSSPHEPLPNAEELTDWMEIGRKTISIDNETYFCDAQVVKDVVSNKTIFDRLEGRELRQARSRSNPFETIGSLFFQNRAAPKMANMDAVFGFMFTNPVNDNGGSLVHCDEPFFFADICAAPGGFSEYVLWRNKETNNGLCRAKGFGFTLKENDFKLSDFFAASPEFFEPHYGLHGDGDIFKSKNISSFVEFVSESTAGQGVHLVMADGGFSVEGQECIQEILSKQLYLCQFLTALLILREDGNFVCKVFDLFTPFSVGLLYLMHLCFKHVSIHKPNTSRPANSERYLICKSKKTETESIENYMFILNEQLQNCRKSEDVIGVVPFELLQDNKEFIDYICSSNNRLGRRQIVALKKIQTFCKNRSLMENRQSAFRSESIAFYQLPSKVRRAPYNGAVEERVENFVKSKELLMTEVNCLSVNNLRDIKSRHDYHFVVLASSCDKYKPERGFFFGMGGNKVFFFDVNEQKWRKLGIRMELPCDTIIFAEIATEITSQGRIAALHLIDGALLNGFDISHFKLLARHHHLKMFAKTINKITRKNITPIRCKELHFLRDLKQVLSPERLRRDAKKRVYLETHLENNEAIDVVPTGVLFLKSYHHDWTRSYSNSKKELYYFNMQNGTSTFTYSHEMNGSITTSLDKGYYWWWNNGVQVTENDPVGSDQLHLATVLGLLDSLPL